MSLQQMREATGLSISTLSKIENGIVELSYTRMIKISKALDIHVTELVLHGEERRTPAAVTARRSITRNGEGSVQDDRDYQSRYLHTDISKKEMIPAVVTIMHRTLEEFGPMRKHGGEELIVVLSGEVAFHTQYYSPVRLSPGDSVYIDSTMPHAVLLIGKEPARILSVCTHEMPRNRRIRSSATRTVRALEP